MDKQKNLEKNLRNRKRRVMEFINGLADKKSFVETEAWLGGEEDCAGAVTGYATVLDVPVYLFAHDPDNNRGGFSYSQAEKICDCMTLAARSGTAFVSVIDSAGARLEGGVSVPEGYSKIIGKASEIKGVVPQIAVINGPCTGLMSVFASLADICVVGKNGSVTLSSPAVLAAREGSDPSAFGADEALESCAAALRYTSVEDLRKTIALAIGILGGTAGECPDPDRLVPGLEGNPSASAALAAVSEDVLGMFERGGSCRAALCRIGGHPACAFAADGELAAADFVKLRKTADIADSFGIPLVTFVNSTGAASDPAAERNNLPGTAADAFFALGCLDAPMISVVTGGAAGAAYSLLASKSAGFDYVLAYAGAPVAPLSADQAANFREDVFKTADTAEEKRKFVEKYGEDEGNPVRAAEKGFVDNVIAGKTLRPYLFSVLNMLL